MAVRAGMSLIRLHVRGAGQLARRFDRAQRGIQDELNREIRWLGREGENVYRVLAPSDTEDLHDAIEAIPYFGTASRPRVRIIVNPLTGHGGSTPYDYTMVTRRGHRRRTIRPTRAEGRNGRPAALKVHYAGHRNPSVFYYAQSVPGVRVGSDWVERGERAIEQLSRMSEDRIGRKIERRVL